jgi:hypothetical protein
VAGSPRKFRRTSDVGDAEDSDGTSLDDTSLVGQERGSAVGAIRQVALVVVLFCWVSNCWSNVLKDARAARICWSL